jgi:hypothetical protein
MGQSEAIHLAGLTDRVIRGPVPVLPPSGPRANPPQVRPDGLFSAPSFPLAGLPAAALVDGRDGAVAAADIVPGMVVHTLGQGWQRVRAAVVVRHVLTPASPRPVVVRGRALGPGPVTDLGIPAGQRVIVDSPRAVQVAGQPRVAIAAADLLHLDGVRQLAPVEDVFVHLLLDRVDAVNVAGLWLETMVPSAAALAALGPEGRRALVAQAPRLAHLAGQAHYAAPWPGLSGREAEEVL